MAQADVTRMRAGRGIAAAAICAGLALAPRPALADQPAAGHVQEDPAVAAQSSSPTDALAEAQRNQVAAQDGVTDAQNDVSEKAALKSAADKMISTVEQDINDVQNAEAGKDQVASDATSKEQSASQAEQEAANATDVSDIELSSKQQAATRAQQEAYAVARTLSDAQREEEHSASDKQAADEAETSAKTALGQRQQTVDADEAALDSGQSALDAAKAAQSGSMRGHPLSPVGEGCLGTTLGTQEVRSRI